MNAHHDDPLDHRMFDANLRARHQASLERLSPRVQAQLAQRRIAVLRGVPLRRAHGLRYAAGFATLCALAIGLQFGSIPTRNGPAAAADSAAGIASTTAAAATMLDEDPEFYAWLASSDAQLVAMESP